MFGSCCRAAARPACRQHVLLHQLGVQLLLKRSGFGIGRDRWCIRVRGCGATCVALAHREPWSDWPAAAGAASTADTAGPFSADVQHGRSSSPHVRDELLQLSHRRRCLGARGASPSRGRRRRQCTRGQLVLGEEGAMVSDISGRQARIGRRSNLLYSCCRIRCIENCCIRPKIAV